MPKPEINAERAHQLKEAVESFEFESEDAAELCDALEQLARLLEQREADRQLHPDGRCRCCGEGTCEWCQRTDLKEKLENAERNAERVRELEHELNEAEQELEERPGADWTAFDRMEAGTVACNRIESLLHKIAASEDPAVFDDWGFDDYDRSVELFDVKAGWHPATHLAALKELGIALVFVNYRDGSAKRWRTDQDSEGQPCSHKQSGSQRIAALERELAAERERLSNAHDSQANLTRKLAEERDLARCLGGEIKRVQGENEILARSRDSWQARCMEARTSADARAERIATLERELAEANQHVKKDCEALADAYLAIGYGDAFSGETLGDQIRAARAELSAAKAENENLHALLKDREYIRELAALHAREGAEND